MSSSYRLRNLTKPEVLKQIAFDLLAEFLQSNDTFVPYLRNRGLRWTTVAADFDFMQLARILKSPDPDTPEPLLDALYLVDKLAGGEFQERIESECEQAGIRREGTMKVGGESDSIYFRPEKFDVLIYYPETGELAIHTNTKGELAAYCRIVGRNVFGDPKIFVTDPPIAKYTLQPLIDHGRQALACADIPGIKRLQLAELQIRHHSDQKDIEIRRCDDALRALAEHKRNLADEADSIELIRAKFKIKYAAGGTETITIEPPNIASFDRDMHNALIHEWLVARGFICLPQFAKIAEVA